MRYGGIKYLTVYSKVYSETRTAVSAASSKPSKARILRPDSLIILNRMSITCTSELDQERTF